MKRTTALLALLSLAAALVVGPSWAADEKDPLEGVKCPISGGPVKAASAIDYKGGKLYFCCNGCPKGFEKDTAKYAAKANHQLAVTGQAKQTACPISGGACKADVKTSVAGTDVCFCCGGCKGKVDKAEGDAQLDLVFSDAAFEKGFKVGDEE